MRELLDQAQVIEGRLDEVVPLEPAAMPDRVVVQWDKEDCADLGIIKIDLLGLGMMAVLEESIDRIREAYGRDVTGFLTTAVAFGVLSPGEQRSADVLADRVCAMVYRLRQRCQ